MVSNTLFLPFLCMLFESCLFSSVALAQQQGGITVRIDNEPDPKCIDSATDKVWLTLYRIVESKDRGFFSNENQAELVVTVKVQAEPQPPQPLSFPLSTKIDIRPYENGQISLPVEYTLISGLDLRQDNDGKTVLYTGFSVDTTLINLKSRGGLGSAIDALSSITGSNKLPIPDNPYTQAANYLLGFANKAIQNDIDEKNSDDKLSTATLSMNFSSDSSCASGGVTGQGFESTGTKAIVLATGVPGDMLIPIDQTDQYCWVADVKPSFVLKATKLVAGKKCGDAGYNTMYRPISNDYLAFFLQKQSNAPAHLGGGPNRQRQQDVGDAKALCDLLDVKFCPAASSE
jgi:hypothetical protein